MSTGSRRTSSSARCANEAVLVLPRLWPYQQRFENESQGFKEAAIVSCPQVGKTVLFAGWLLSLAWANPRTLWWWCAPVGHQLSPGFDEIDKLANDRGILARRRLDQPKAHTLIQGSRIEYRTWEREENLGGPSVYGIVVDEAHLLTKRANSLIRARRAHTLGPIRYSGNASYEASEWWFICRRAEKEGRAGGLYFAKWTWRDKLATLHGERKREYRAFIENERKRLGTEDFERLYEAAFLRLGSGLIDLPAVCVNGGDAMNPIALPYREPWGEDEEPCMGGLDLGEKQAWSVLSIFGRKTGRLKFMDRFHQMGWKAQVARIVREASTYGRLEPAQSVTICFDETGVGGPVAEELYAAAVGKPIAFNGVTFNQDNKQSMVNAIQIGTESRSFSMPYIAEAIDECDLLQRKALKSGVSYEAPPGGSSDIVWSLGLALHGMNQVVSGVPV
jgi:hypothetical protein